MDLDETVSPTRKSDFYLGGYGYLQAIRTPDNQTTRIVFGEGEYKRILGVYEGINHFLPIKEALKKGYEVAYNLQNTELLKTSYVTFEAPLNKELFEIIDMAYEQIGHKNMYLKRIEDRVLVYLKECSL